jgi:hypothetical protein
MPRLLVVSAALALLAAQSQTPPPATPPTSPFAAAVAKRAEATGDPVSLSFDWPPGLTATIESERIKTTITPQGRKTQSGSIRYRMRVSAHKDGRLIEYDGFEPFGVSATGAEQAAMDQMLSSLMPSLIVDKTGAFVRVGDLTALRKALSQFVDGLLKQTPSNTVPPNIKTLLQSLTSEKVLTQVAAADWQALVGGYAGFSGRIGAMKEVSTEEASPMIPGVMMPMRTTFGAHRRIPCRAGHPLETCVVMQMRSAVSPEAMEAVLRRLLEGMKGMEGVKYHSFAVTNEFQTTMEPGTMRPHQATRTKNVEFSATIPGQGRANASTIERQSFRFIYN